MQIATGTIVAGKVVVEDLTLREGAAVTVLADESEVAVCLSSEEEAELLEAIAEADRGETISIDQLRVRLCRDN